MADSEEKTAEVAQEDEKSNAGDYGAAPEAESLLDHVIKPLEKLENSTKAASDTTWLPDEAKATKMKQLTDYSTKAEALIGTIREDITAVETTRDRIAEDKPEAKWIEDLRNSLRVFQEKVEKLEEELVTVRKDEDAFQKNKLQIEAIKPSQFADLKNMKRPPKVLEHVLLGIGTLFGLKQQWSDVKRFMIESGTKDKILNFDPSIATKRNIQRTRNWVDANKESFEPARVQRASKTFAPLATWLVQTVELVTRYKKRDSIVSRYEKASEKKKAATVTARRIDLEEDVRGLQNEQNECSMVIAEVVGYQEELDNIKTVLTGLEERVKTVQASVTQLQKVTGSEETDEKAPELRKTETNANRQEYKTQVLMDWKSMMKKKKKPKMGRAWSEPQEVGQSRGVGSPRTPRKSPRKRRERNQRPVSLQGILKMNPSKLSQTGLEKRLKFIDERIDKLSTEKNSESSSSFLKRKLAG